MAIVAVRVQVPLRVLLTLLIHDFEGFLFNVCQLLTNDYSFFHFKPYIFWNKKISATIRIIADIFLFQKI